MVKQAIKETYFALNGLIGVAGFEQDVVRFCRDWLAPLADELTVTTTGNLIATFHGRRPGYRMMLAAHVDEVGYIVKHIRPDGFLLFERLGNPVAKTMPSRRLLLQGKHGVVPGVIGLTPGHVETAEEAGRVNASKDSYIDVGAADAADAAAMGIEVGTVAVPDSPAIEMYHKDLIMGRAADDRINCAVLLELAKELKEMDFAGTVDLVLSVQEEIGVIGAKQVTAALRPDYCVVLDTFPAGGTPDVPVTRLPVRMGGGPVISLVDTLVGPMTCGYVTNKKLVELARDVSQKEGISLQFITMCEDHYGTDAIGITNEGSHCPCVSLGMPRRYSHAPNEMFSMADAADIYRLVKGMVEKNGELDLSFLG